MKRLYILRHAKSSWAQPGLGDIDRPLNTRGKRQLEVLSPWFEQQPCTPCQILCSPAVRTRETLDGIIKAAGDAPTEFIDRMYNGTVDNYLEVLWPQTADNLILIGHNPTCDELARFLTNPSSPAAELLMARHFGTANVAVLEYTRDNWSELSESSCSLIDFIRPKDLQHIG